MLSVHHKGLEWRAEGNTLSAFSFHCDFEFPFPRDIERLWVKADILEVQTDEAIYHIIGDPSAPHTVTCQHMGAKY